MNTPKRTLDHPFWARFWWLPTAAVLILFSLWQIPKIGLTPHQENVFERQAQYTGMIRLYCFDSARHPLASPQLPYGRGAFNMEFSGMEWLQGAVARLWDGGSCDSAEVVAQWFSLISALLGLLAASWILLLAAEKISEPPLNPSQKAWASFLGALCLAIDPIWMRFASYRLMDLRVVTLAFFGTATGWLYAKQRRTVWLTASLLLWTLSGAMRPQSFVALAPFFLWTTFILERQSKRSWTATLTNPVFWRGVVPMILGGAIALSYHVYSTRFNSTHDLPWMTWWGPRINQVYFGNMHERFQWPFWKGQILDVFHKTGLAFALGAAVLSLFFGRRSPQRIATSLVLLAMPLFIGRWAYTFIFHTVYLWHDYYAVPLNALGALTQGAVIWGISREAQLWGGQVQKPKAFCRLSTGLAALALAFWSGHRWREDYLWTAHRHHPDSPLYSHNWNVPIFPASDKPFEEPVVIVNPDGGRVLTFLYLGKHPGFTWCIENRAFAPRAFWKSQGVRYIAWPQGDDPVSRRRLWKIVTMEEELETARKNGWSSDVEDVWAGASMDTWARWASVHGHDPCDPLPEHQDPRRWGLVGRQ